MMLHSAAPATRLIARAFTGTSIRLLHLSQDTCHSCFRDHVLQATASERFIGLVRIAPMSRRRTKCFVSIAGVGRGFPFPISLEGTTIQTIQTPQGGDTSPIQGPGSIPRNRLSSCRWFARHDRRLRWGGRRTAQRDRRKRDQTSTADHFRVPAERGGRRAVPLGLIGLILD